MAIGLNRPATQTRYRTCIDASGSEAPGGAGGDASARPLDRVVLRHPLHLLWVLPLLTLSLAVAFRLVAREPLTPALFLGVPLVGVVLGLAWRRARPAPGCRGALSRDAPSRTTAQPSSRWVTWMCFLFGIHGLRPDHVVRLRERVRYGSAASRGFPAARIVQPLGDTATPPRAPTA